MESAPTKRRKVLAESDDEESEDGRDEFDPHQNEHVVNGSDDEGEDIMENVMDDYERIDELDRYDDDLLDKRQYSEMDQDTRRRAEEEIRKRDEHYGKVQNYMHETDNAEDIEIGEVRNPFKRDRDLPGEPEPEFDVNLDAFDCSLQEWLAQDLTRKEIGKRFKGFLSTFVRNGRAVHAEKIRDMCARNSASLEVSYRDLSEHSPILAIWLADAPKTMLQIFDEVANEVVVTAEHFPEYRRIVDEIHVRISELPISDKLRELRQSHLNAIVKVQGVVTRRSAVFPQLKEATYNCIACGYLSLPFRQTGGGELKPTNCISCQGNGPFRLNSEKTIYRNFQKISLQETPGSVPPGRVPRQKEVILVADLIDRAKPGEEIEVIGIYQNSQECLDRGGSGFPVFGTQIEANHISKKDDMFSNLGLSDSDRSDILKLSRDPHIGEKIVRSFAPSIYGNDHVKMAVMLALFGGCPKNVNNKHRIRGDINVLLLGDPGTAKSQVLKYVEKIAPRAVYTTGKGASAVGLTAGVRKDPMTKEWTLEGGALVLADKGICLIDEFDKMSEQDRTSIHEAMEQQSISVSKAGIVTSLQARCSVIAAANPIDGVYDSSCTLAENVLLTDPILQRFDVLCVLQDNIDPIVDEALASFVVGSHQRSHKNAEHNENEEEEKAVLNDHGEKTIPQELLQKYIQYARSNVTPSLQGIDEGKLSQLYADLRRESATSGGVPIAVRHIESVMRMAEAHAKMHLRDHVRDDDLNVAIRVMLESFISAQKFSVRRSLRRGFQPYLTQNKDFNELMMHALLQFAKDAVIYYQHKNKTREMPPQTEVFMDELDAKAREYKVFDLGDFYSSASFKANGFEADHARRVIIRKF